MSYILDALRKSDQQRQQGKSPTLSSGSLHDLTPSRITAKSSSMLPYALIALALIGIGIAIGLLRPWQTAPIPTESLMAPPKNPPRVPPPASLPSTTLASPTMTTTVTIAETATPTTSSTITLTTVPRADSKPKAEAPVTTEPPNITITVHAYASEPKERLAGINGRLLREGQEISPGLRLERITEDGVILNFRGRSFPRNVRQ